MGFYGADIGELRRLAQSLTTASESLETTRGGLQSTVTGARWAGPDGDELRGRWTSELGPALAAAAATLRDAADKVRTNADQQESASSDGTGGGGSGPGGSGSGSGGSGSGGSGSGGSGSGGSGDGGESGDGSGGPTVSVKGSQGGGSDNGGLGSPATEGTDSKVGFGVSHDPDSGETTYSGNGSLADWFKTTDGSKVSFGVNGGAEYTVGEKSEDGFTTYTSKSDVSIGVEGGVSKGGTGVSGGYTTGVTSEYTLKMPDGTDVDPGSVNPFDPRSMPVGSSVTMDGGSYAKTELDAAFRHIALESSVKDSEGVSSLIERTGDDTVRVTAGPTEAIANHAGLGLDFDAVKVMLGNTTSLDGASLRSAEFDLSTPEGQAAYDTYLVTGEIPGDPSTGISGTTTIERVNYDSTSTVGFDTPVGGAEWQIGQNTGSLVATTYPDGSTEQLLTATYGDRGDFRLSQSFDASGTEDLSARTYSFDVTADDMSSQYFNTRDFSGFSPSGDVSPGQQVTMTLTESQMNRLADSVRTAVENDALGMQTRAIVTDYDMQPLSDPYQLATSLARAADSDLDLVMMISEINAAGDGSVTDRSAARFPGTVTLGN